MKPQLTDEDPEAQGQAVEELQERKPRCWQMNQREKNKGPHGFQVNKPDPDTCGKS